MIANERRRAAATFATITALIGVIVLLGWTLDVEVMKNFVPEGIVTLPNAACAFIIAGLAIALRTHEAPGATLASILVAAIGAAATAERLFDVDLGIDRLLFFDAVRQYPYLPPGRIATNSSIALALAGAALLLLDGRRQRVARWLATTGLAIATLALVGHFFGAQRLYAVDAAAGMALPTALGFATMFAGILAARPPRGWLRLLTGHDLGAILARRHLLWIVVVPLALGWLWVLGRDANLVSREVAAAVFTLVTMAVLGALMLRSATELRRTDIDRRRALHREALGHARADALRIDAEAANDAKAYFLAAMSHELRTPLNAIIGYAELLEMGMRGETTEAQRADLNRIGQSARYLTSIISDILSFAKGGDGEQAFRLLPVRAAELLESLRIVVTPLGATRDVSLVVEPCDPELTVTTDPERLRQILVNLVSNALKFTRAGGTVTVQCVPTPSSVDFEVADTGIGIAAADFERIFAPFVQLDLTLTGAQRGLGLGLAISRELARRLGGEIHVESRVGEGSTFTVRLPLAVPRMQRDTPRDVAVMA